MKYSLSLLLGLMGLFVYMGCTKTEYDNVDATPAVALPELSIADISVNEGDDTSYYCSFTVSLSYASDKIVTVDCSTSDGSAVSGSDYVFITDTLIFYPHDRERRFSVCVNGDFDLENTETFLAVLSNPVNANLGVSQAMCTINDNDSGPVLPVLSVSDCSVGESGSSVDFTITLSESSADVVTVGCYTSSGSAVSGDDFVYKLGTITFNPGDTQKTFSVSILSDSLHENDESFGAVLYSPVNAKLFKHKGECIIYDDDTAPSISVADQTVWESDDGRMLCYFDLCLSESSGRDISVDCGTADGSAIAGVDYMAKNDTVIIPAGDIHGMFVVEVNGDTNSESDESFIVNLSNPVNVIVSDGQAVGTISNDDPGNVICVDQSANGLNDGSSWTNAYVDLQTALAAAASGDKIWVAAGNYTPTTGSTRSISFDIPPGVSIYGGFTGSETSISQRDWTANQTYLNGDIDDNDDVGNFDNNAYHVVTASADCIIDGLVILGGTVTETTAPDCFGGGLYCINGKVSVRNCVFRDNRIFSTLGAGGGAYCEDGWVVFDNCKFLANVSNDEVAGLCLLNCRGVVIDSVFTANRGVAAGLSAGISMSGDYGTLVESCVFSGNTIEGSATSFYGDAGALFTKCPALIRNSVVCGNQSNYAGGANAFDRCRIENTLFVGNKGIYGGGIRGYSADIALVNCTIAYNEAKYGGAVRLADGCQSEIVNSILWGNASPYSHCEIWLRSASSSLPVNLVIHHSLIDNGWNNTENVIANGNHIVVSDNGTASNLDAVPAFMTSLEGEWTGTGVYNSDTCQTTLYDTGTSFPGDLHGKLLNPDVTQRLQYYIVSNTDNSITVYGDLRTVASVGDSYLVYDYHLDYDSPCVDSGDIAGSSGADFNGVVRPQGAGVDMGVYER